ncbi:hypothetical protein JL101_032450 (plasmid) [Skermanella rosea]|uniref:hypothetical protein n=1 Tax=Skermanella rosea TaxID=1817965 RepID=UPI0019342949|nr:hypothetical protein [Skermanella rosea]UEM07625.1 hypothetical protein JL101_032450 [Skermanella rosea]
MSIAVGKIRAAAQNLKDNIGGDPGRARDVLRAEGVLTAKGTLTKRYSKGPQQMAEYLYTAARGAAVVLSRRPTLKGSAARIATRSSVGRAKGK